MQDEFKRIFCSNFVNNKSTSFKMRFFNQLQICINIWNIELVNVEKKVTLHYKALIKIFRLKNDEFFNQIYKMFEVERWLKNQVKNLRSFNYCCFYKLSNITRNAHLISVTMKRKTANVNFKIWYVNNYIDWKWYNIYYNSEYWLLDSAFEKILKMRVEKV